MNSPFRGAFPAIPLLAVILGGCAVFPPVVVVDHGLAAPVPLETLVEAAGCAGGWSDLDGAFAAFDKCAAADPDLGRAVRNRIQSRLIKLADFRCEATLTVVERLCGLWQASAGLFGPLVAPAEIAPSRPQSSCWFEDFTGEARRRQAETGARLARMRDGSVAEYPLRQAIKDAEAYDAACSALPRSGGLYPARWSERDLNAFLDQLLGSGREIRARLDRFDIKCEPSGTADGATTCVIAQKKPAGR